MAPGAREELAASVQNEALPDRSPVKKRRPRKTKAERAKLDRFLGVLREHAGVPALVARALRIPRAEVIATIEREPAAQQVLREVEATLDDIARSRVIAGVNAGDKGMVRSYLNSRERDGGAAPRGKFAGLSPAQIRSLATCLL
jgi:hypothetical protein